MRVKVLSCRLTKSLIIPKMTEPFIAESAEKTSYISSSMIMVYMRMFSGLHWLAADCTQSRL